MRVLVTGASRGLGAVVAAHYAAQGHEVFPFSRKELDFTKLSESKLSQVNASLPPDLDAVIHCAGGGLGMRDPLLNALEFNALFMTNLGGQAEINRLVLPWMMRAKKGYICHVCSIASGEAVGSVGYNTVKAALSAYVRSLGREMAPFGVVVSGIAPGGFTAPGNSMERLKERNPQVYAEFEKSRLPRGRMGTAEELLPLIQLLTSEAGSMMAGCVVPIDAGESKAYIT